jgi:hypothetical protein
MHRTKHELALDIVEQRYPNFRSSRGRNTILQ